MGAPRTASLKQFSSSFKHPSDAFRHPSAVLEAPFKALPAPFNGASACDSAGNSGPNTCTSCPLCANIRATETVYPPMPPIRTPGYCDVKSPIRIVLLLSTAQALIHSRLLPTAPSRSPPPTTAQCESNPTQETACLF